MQKHIDFFCSFLYNGLIDIGKGDKFMKRLTLKDLHAKDCINLLEPMKCDCGCGGYLYPVFKGQDDCIEAAGSLLDDIDCNHAMTFIMTDSNVIFAYKCEDGISVYSSDWSDEFDLNDQIDFVAGIIEKIQPHCIGVLQSIGDGTYRIVTDEVYDRDKIMFN